MKDAGNRPPPEDPEGDQEDVADRKDDSGSAELGNLLEDLLRRMEHGDEDAKHAVFKLLYDDLKRRAVRQMKGQPKGWTLQPTDLVGELYMKLANAGHTSFSDSAHFLAFCAKVMRNVLVDYARRKKAKKRGGDRNREGYEGLTMAADGFQVSVIDLNEALREFEQINPEGARIVELKFFGRATNKQIAEMMNRSTSWVEAKYTFAKAWLRRRLGG